MADKYYTQDSSSSYSSSSSSESEDDCVYHTRDTTEIVTSICKKYHEKKTFYEKFKVIWEFFSHAFPNMSSEYSKTVKSIGESKRWRETGNKEYKAKGSKYLKKSIEAFTKSIAAAPLKSKELSLAYANRSAALLTARLFEDCLLDIERALASGYPDNLKAKLFARQSLCFHALMPSLKLESKIPLANTFQWLPAMNRKDPSYSTVFNILTNYKKFSKSLGKPRDNVNTGIFIPKIRNKNPNFIGASDAIAIKTTKKNGRHVVATRDINPGEFIYVDKPFETIVADEKRFTHCWHCFEETCSGLACDNCPNVIFCSQACKNDAWKEYHILECPVLSTVMKLKSNTKYQMTLKIVARALKSAGSLSALKKQIDDVDDSNSKNLGSLGGTFIINSLDTFHRINTIDDCIGCPIEMVTDILMCVMTFGLDTNVLGKNKSFQDVYRNKNAPVLGEVMLRYMMAAGPHFVCYTNCSEDNIYTSVTSAVLPILQEFKYSKVEPHVSSYTDGKIVSIAVSRPVKKGHTVLMSLIGQHQGKEVFEQHTKLTKDILTRCSCVSCVDIRSQMSLPSYQTMKLPRKVRSKLDSMMNRSRDYIKIITQGNSKEVSRIVNNVINMTETFYQCVPAPCIEMCKFSSMLRQSYHLLHLRPSIFD